MEVEVEGKKLVIKPGFLQKEVVLDINDINSWELVVDDLGNPFLYFVFNGLRQGISLPAVNVDVYKDKLTLIEQALGIKPKVEISNYQELFKTGNSALFGIELFILALTASR